MKLEFLWIQKASVQQYSSTRMAGKTKRRKRKNHEKKKKKKNVTKSKKSKELRGGSPTNSFLVGNYGLRRAERWDDMPSMSSEVGEV